MATALLLIPILLLAIFAGVYFLVIKPIMDKVGEVTTPLTRIAEIRENVEERIDDVPIIGDIRERIEDKIQEGGIFPLPR